MNITRQNIDELNAVITVQVAKTDYTANVEKVLANYRKTAAIPGFRKGTVPMSMIQKQYGKTVLLEEVNKVLQENLNKYLQQEKIDLLGNPLPKMTENFNWDADDYDFEFELGLTPKFDVNLESAEVTHYQIVADEKMINDQIGRIRKQYGKLVSQSIADANSDISGTFRNEEKGIESTANFSLDIFKNKEAGNQFVGKKVGDVVVLNTKGLFDDDHKLMDYLKVSHDDVHGLDVDVHFTIEEINSTEMAELNQDFYDKLFGEGNVTSEADLKAKIKEDAEKQFATQADQKFLNDVSNTLLEKTKFDLPEVFLKKWIQTAGESPLTPEQAETEFSKSENGLRYQLIEGKIMASNDLRITFEDLKAFTSEVIRKQMAQFGQTNPTDADVESIVSRVLSNQDEVKRLSEQVMSEKMLSLFKEKVKIKTEEVSYDEFIKKMYGE